MDGLLELDRLQVIVVVDNETDGLSQPCPSASSGGSACAAKYTSELSGAISLAKGGGAQELDFSAICQAGHGYSLLLQADAPGGRRHTLLFDGGPSGDLWRHNAAVLRLPLAEVDAAVLSHWHIDHSVGLAAAAEACSQARAADGGSSGSDSRPPLVVDLHPKRPHRRGLQLPTGVVVPFNEEPALDAFEHPGVEVQLHDEPHCVCGGAFFVSGPIPRHHTSYEAGNPAHVSQWTRDGSFELDEEVADERFVAARVKGRGSVVFSACSHAGIVNVMRCVQCDTGEAPHAVFGGFHLAPKDTHVRTAATVADIAALKPALVVGGHCTGWMAKAALAQALPDTYMPSFVGARFTITAAAAG